MFVLIVGVVWYAPGIISKPHFLLPSFFFRKDCDIIYDMYIKLCRTFLLVSLFFSIEKINLNRYFMEPWYV